MVDGELVILRDGRLSFDALQQRLVTADAKVQQLITAAPASYMAFDLLAVAGVDIRTQRWTTRRQRLETLALPPSGWSPPLQLSPVTQDPDEAREWVEVLPAAMGVEGVVAKGVNPRYLPGVRGWLKVNSDGLSRVRFTGAAVIGTGKNEHKTQNSFKPPAPTYPRPGTQPSVTPTQPGLAVYNP